MSSSIAATRERNLRSTYGITLEDFEAALVRQEGKCAICGTTDPGGRWETFCVDHDHETQEMRGLLCSHCNRGLGHFRDDPNLLDKAAQYLREKGAA